MNELDEMDIRIIKEALERDLKFHHHMNINPFYEVYYPRLIEKVDRIRQERETAVMRRLEVMK